MNIVRFVVALIVMEGGVIAGVYLLQTADQEIKKMAITWKGKVILLITLLYIIPAAYNVCRGDIEMIGCVFWPSIALAAYSDACTKQVYDLVYVLAFLVGFLWIGCGIYQGKIPGSVLVQCILFIALQWGLFRRLYGESDCIAFSTCAVYAAMQKKLFITDMYVMAAAWVLLALVQLVRKNVNRHGNLKEPVALIPYIAIAAMIVL